MTFEQFRFLKCGDPWDISRSARKLDKPPRFVKHRGRVYNVVARLDDVMKVETIHGRFARKVLHELDLDLN